MIEMGVIPAGTTLWHGTGAEVGFTVPHGPAWFSDSRAVAYHFAWLHAPMIGPTFPARVMKFVVVDDIELPVITHRESRGTGRPDYENEVWTSDPWRQFIRSFKIGGEDDDVDQFADRVCRRYNGWRVVNNYDTGDDIMLCNPERWVKRVKSDFWRRR